MFSKLSSAITATCMLLMAGNSFAMTPAKDSISTNIRKYVDEIGFYQKANRDLSDPRFMFSDEKGKIDFGIGGMAKITTFYGFSGEVGDMQFKPAAIAIPTDLAGRYSMSMNGTEVHFKVRSELRGHKLGAFVKIKSNHDKEIELDQAYISIDNFSIGIIPSFLMDLEVGVMTSGNGLGSQVDISNPLIGYTFRPNKNLSIAAAIEWPDLVLDHYQGIGIKTCYQPVPDFTGHIKYSWKKAHVQLGTVLRDLTYESLDATNYQYPNYATHILHEFGYGLSLTGNYKPSDKLKLSWEFTGGHGYARYLANLADQNLDLGIYTILGSPYPTLATIPASSDQIAVQYNFAKNFTSSAIFGYSFSGKRARVTRADNFCESYSAIANLFWNMDDYSYIGLEYLFGTRKIYTDIDEPDFGRAHRIVFVMAYCF